jgi:hypothetical protein
LALSLHQSALTVIPGLPASPTGVMRLLGRVSLLVLLIGVLGACARSTTLSGCVVIETAAGESKPAAGTVVMIVAGSDAFEREWHAVEQGFRYEYERARATYDQARTRYRAARSAEQHASRAYALALRVPPFQRYVVREDEQSGVRLWTNQDPPPPVWAAARAKSDGSQALADAARQLNALIDLHLGRVVHMVTTRYTRLMLADAGGCYSARVPVGRVYVFANHADRYWFRQLDARSTPAQLDFSPANAGWPSADIVRPG